MPLHECECGKPTCIWCAPPPPPSLPDWQSALLTYVQDPQSAPIRVDKGTPPPPSVTSEKHFLKDCKYGEGHTGKCEPWPPPPSEEPVLGTCYREKRPHAFNGAEDGDTDNGCIAWKPVPSPESARDRYAEAREAGALKPPKGPK